MSSDVRATAIRFADLWAVDPHQMVDEIYAEGIVMENMANPARVIRGSVELHAVEDVLASRIPEHRHELVRVIAASTEAGTVACLETIVVGPVTGEYAPACVWWWLDETGKVAEEVGWFEWADRTTDSNVTHGTVPPNSAACGDHDSQWYRGFAERFAHTWEVDRLGAYLALFAQDCTFGHVGRQEHRGLGALAEAEHFMPDASRGRHCSMAVHAVIGEASVIAMLVTISDETHETRGTIVLTLDDHDLIVSRRSYLDWAKAVPRSPRN